MDEDRSGAIDVEEFVLGANKLKGPARYIDMLKTQTSFEQVNKQLDAIHAKLGVQSMVQDALKIQGWSNVSR